MLEKINVLQANTLRTLRALTYSLSQAIHSLPVGVRLVPDVRVGQVGWGVEPLLKQMTLDGHHQMHLGQADRHLGGSHGDFKKGVVSGCPRAQIAQVQTRTGDLQLFMKNLCAKKESQLKKEALISDDWRFPLFFNAYSRVNYINVTLIREIH